MTHFMMRGVGTNIAGQCPMSMGPGYDRMCLGVIAEQLGIRLFIGELA